jgi:hypothetical protein
MRLISKMEALRMRNARTRIVGIFILSLALVGCPQFDTPDNTPQDDSVKVPFVLGMSQSESESTVTATRYTS